MSNQIHDELWARLRTARKQRDTSNVALYSTLLGELSRSKIKQEPTDRVMLKILEDSRNGLVGLLSKRENEQWRADLTAVEGLIEEFKIEMVDQSSINQTIDQLISEGAGNLGDIMPRLKATYGDNFNGKEAQKYASMKLSAAK